MGLISFHVSFFPTGNALATPFGYSGSNTGSTFSGFALAGGGTPLFGASNTPFGELGGGGRGGQARIHTGFHRFTKIGQSCHKEINFS